MKKPNKAGFSIRPKARTKHSVKRAAARKMIRHYRPFHRHIALSPLGVLAMLCAGVLLGTFTIDAAAGTWMTQPGTITVTAEKPAPALTDPAVLETPTDGTQTSTQQVVASGTCPANSYVIVLDNGDNMEGEQLCTNGTFDVGFDLSTGANLIQAQDYNVTNDAGPTSPGVTVTYTPPPPPTPPVTTTTTTTTTTETQPKTAVPTELLVTQVDLGVPLEVTGIQDISYQPTFSGVAPPFSKIFIVVHSNVFTCDSVTNAQGYWSCTLPDYLPAEVHHVDVSAKTPQGTTLTYPQFEVKVTGQAPPAQTAPSTFKISSSYIYAIYNIGQTVSYNIHVTGGRAPYAFTVLWGDGGSSTIVRQDDSDFTVSHKYGWIKAVAGTRIVKIQGISADGQASTLQFSVPLRNSAYQTAVANATKSAGLQGLYNAFRPWLWLLWPGYAIIILLAFSFWLGEREEMRRLMTMKRIPPVVGKNHHLHFHR